MGVIRRWGRGFESGHGLGKQQNRTNCPKVKRAGFKLEKERSRCVRTVRDRFLASRRVVLGVGRTCECAGWGVLGFSNCLANNFPRLAGSLARALHLLLGIFNAQRSAVQQVALQLLAGGGGVGFAVKVNEADGHALRIELEAETTESIAALKEVDQIGLGSEKIQIREEEGGASARTVVRGRAGGRRVRGHIANRQTPRFGRRSACGR